jgi:hypothetical protein
MIKKILLSIIGVAFIAYLGGAYYYSLKIKEIKELAVAQKEIIQQSVVERKMIFFIQMLIFQGLEENRPENELLVLFRDLGLQTKKLENLTLEWLEILGKMSEKEKEIKHLKLLYQGVIK